MRTFMPSQLVICYFQIDDLLLERDLTCVWILYFGNAENAFLLEYILENAFSRMHFAENSAFGKILKLFIRSDYAERNCVWLVF